MSSAVLTVLSMSLTTLAIVRVAASLVPSTACPTLPMEEESLLVSRAGRGGRSMVNPESVFSAAARAPLASTRFFACVAAMRSTSALTRSNFLSATSCSIFRLSCANSASVCRRSDPPA